MKIRIMFDTIEDLGAFTAKPQDLEYLSEPFIFLGSYCIDANLNGLTSLEDIKNRVVNGVAVGS